jgi:hypothetical protein
MHMMHQDKCVFIFLLSLCVEATETTGNQTPSLIILCHSIIQLAASFHQMYLCFIILESKFVCLILNFELIKKVNYIFSKHGDKEKKQTVYRSGRLDVIFPFIYHI